LVTASTDNVICFWKSFTGVESKKVVIPDDIVSAEKGNNVQYVKFPFANRKDYLLVVTNNGEMYILET
jgi:orotate phosphoribosyltransferase-like protein